MAPVSERDVEMDFQVAGAGGGAADGGGVGASSNDIRVVNDGGLSEGSLGAAAGSATCQVVERAHEANTVRPAEAAKPAKADGRVRRAQTEEDAALLSAMGCEFSIAEAPSIEAQGTYRALDL